VEDDIVAAEGTGYSEGAQEEMQGGLSAMGRGGGAGNESGR